MSKYVDKNLIMQLVEISIDQIEEMIDNMSLSDMNNVDELIKDGIESGFLEPDVDNEFTHQEIVAGMGIMHLAMNLANHSRMLLADPTKHRSAKRRTKGGREIVDIIETDVTEAEIAVNVSSGISDIEKYLSELNAHIDFGSDS